MKHYNSSRMKKFIAVLLLLMTVFSVTGCSRFKNTEIVITTGLSSDELFKIGKSVCTKSEAMVYVQTYEKQYEDVYGIGIWQHDFGGQTLEEYVKNNIISQLAVIKAMTILAEEYEVKLSDSEKNGAKICAAEYMDTLTKQEIAWMDISEKEVVGLYEEHILAEKVYNVITQDVNTEVSDDEARIITVQQLFFSTEGLTDAERIERLTQLQILKADLESDNMKDFFSVAASNSDDPTITCSIGRGERSAEFETVAFDLEDGQISEIIETEDGYYLLKCVENFEKEATEANKMKMVEHRKEDAFQVVYDELIANTMSEFNSGLWEKTHLDNPDPNTASVSFFDIYDKYF